MALDETPGVLGQGLAVIVALVRNELEIQELGEDFNKSEIFGIVQDMLSLFWIRLPAADGGRFHARARGGGDESSGGLFESWLGDLEGCLCFQDPEGFPLLVKQRLRVWVVACFLPVRPCVVSDGGLSTRVRRWVPGDGLGLCRRRKRYHSHGDRGSGLLRPRTPNVEGIASIHDPARTTGQRTGMNLGLRQHHR